MIDSGESRAGRGRKRGHGGILDQIEMSARLEVPPSPATGRMLLGQVNLNRRFLSEIMSTKLHFAGAGEPKQAISRELHTYLQTHQRDLLLWASRLADHFTRYVPIVAGPGGNW